MQNLQGELHQIAEELKERATFMKKSGITYLPRATDPKNPFDADQKALNEIIHSKASKEQRLARIKAEIVSECARCKLGKTRTNIVFGTGSADADLVFVGEAPGAEEDAQGEPFVGRAGKLLTKMIEAMGFRREDVYICNVIKSRPPGNRDPEPEEVAACEPFLKAQLEVINPKVIVTLGRFASQCLLQTTEPMSAIRGRWGTYENIAVMPTFHPAYLLRSPTKKKEVWEDLQEVMKKLGKKNP